MGPHKPAIRTWRAPDGPPSSQPTLGLPSASRPNSAGATPDGIPRVKFHDRPRQWQLAVDVAAKAVRKAQTAICNAGAEENVFVMLQGKLVRDEILEADLVAALSRRKQGFESPRERQLNQWLSERAQISVQRVSNKREWTFVDSHVSSAATSRQEFVAEAGGGATVQGMPWE